MVRIKRRHVLGFTVCVILVRKRRYRVKRRKELRKWRQVNRSVHGTNAKSPTRIARTALHASK